VVTVCNIFFFLFLLMRREDEEFEIIIIIFHSWEKGVSGIHEGVCYFRKWGMYIFNFFVLRERRGEGK